MAQKQTRESQGKLKSNEETEVLDSANNVALAGEVDEEDDEIIEEDEDAPGQRDHMHEPVTLHLSRSLIRKLRDNSREEGVTMEELASELVAEGVVLRAWEIVERKATMRGGNASQGSQNNQNNFNRGSNGGGNHAGGNHGNHPSPHAQKHLTPQNRMAQKKLQRQTRQHANAMDLMADKAAFIEYVRNQEKKRR